jgi:hypothetical protein
MQLILGKKTGKRVLKKCEMALKVLESGTSISSITKEDDEAYQLAIKKLTEILQSQPK